MKNRRGSADYKVSKGSKNSSLIEFKLASNTKLKKNIQKQVEIYKKANFTDRAIKVIGCKDIVLIDARDNKVSAFNV